MHCPHCNKEIPAVALFCIYCGTQLPESREIDVAAPSGPAATGPTIDLGRGPAVAPPLTPGSQAGGQGWQPYHGQSVGPRQHQPPRGGRSSGGLWLVIVGAMLLFVLFKGPWWPLLGLFFGLPGLLLLCGVLSYSRKSSQGRHAEALRSLVWLGGLALLFVTGLWWPGILFLFLIMSLLRPSQRGWC